jgi:hypothetical protein
MSDKLQFVASLLMPSAAIDKLKFVGQSLEPAMGIEPMTSSLPRMRSTTELRRRLARAAESGAGDGIRTRNI